MSKSISNKSDFKRRLKAFKNEHNLVVNDAFRAPLPDPLLPVPEKIRVTVDDVSFDLDPHDMTALETLGHGAHGTVCRMIHKPTSVVLAVKRIPWKLSSTDQTSATMLRRELEVSLAASLCHNVVRCYGALYKECAVWICMEVMDASLEKFYKIVFSNNEEMPEYFIGAVAYGIINALHFLKSELCVIHRDVKPSNILINRNGAVKICDFGISGKLVDSLANSHVGSRNYMAPERVNTEGQGYDITSDVWSLGISMIELATGVFPYDAWKTPFEQLEQVVKGPPPRLPPNRFSSEFENFIEQCLQKDAQSRAKYVDLLQHPFIVQHKTADVSSFITATLNKCTSQHVDVSGDV